MGSRIAIIGTGAVGGYAGAHMAQAGEDVTFVDFWPENVETMRTKGLRISHLRDVPEFTTPARALHVTELQRFCKDRLAPFKYPRWIEFLETLPKTATGKIQRFKLRQG